MRAATRLVKFWSAGLTGGDRDQFLGWRHNPVVTSAGQEAFGWAGAHLLQSWNHTQSRSPPTQAMSYSHCLPSHPHAACPSGGKLPWQSLPSAFFRVIVAVETAHPHTLIPQRFPWVRLCSRAYKNVRFYIQGFFIIIIILKHGFALKCHEIGNYIYKVDFS